MKRRILLAVVVALGATTTMVSCKKDYTCKCTKTYTPTNGTQVITEDGVYVYKDKMTKAQERCDANESQGSDIGGSYVRNCDLD